LKIGINAVCLNNRPSGARQRFVGLYGELFRIMPDAEFVIFQPCDCAISEWFPRLPNLSFRATPVPSSGRLRRLITGFLYWHKTFSQEYFDIFECLHLPLKAPRNSKVVFTRHDIRGLEDSAKFMERRLLALFLHQALKRSSHVITVSETMLKQIGRLYPRTLVSVIYNGIDVKQFTSVPYAEQEAFIARYSLPKNFILSVGHMEHRKNYARLICAMALLKERGQDFSLVIIGNDSGAGSLLREQIASLKLSDRVFLLSGLTDFEVRCAYLTCTLFIFPSLYEGFGIPILEAMAAKRPMALSNLDVFREVTQGQAIYFNPIIISDIADAIEFVIESPEVAEKMVRYGETRLKDFSFSRLAKQLAIVYRSIASSRHE
jgi:glycosyltransferase involved in cell wall biosynthesis